MGNIKWTMDADTDRAVRGLLKIVEAEKTAAAKLALLGAEGKKAGAAMEGMGRKSEGAGKKSESAFGSMKRNLASVLGSAISVTAAIGLATKALAATNAEANRGADLLRGMQDPFAKLAQISGGDPEGLSRRIKLASTLAYGAAIPLAQAAETIFAVESLQGVGEADIARAMPFGRVASEGGMDVALRGAGKLKAAFQGGDPTGSIQALINKGLVAAKKSDVAFAEIFENTLTVAPFFKMIGATDEEALSAVSIMSGPGGKTAEETATSVRALADVMRKGGVKGGFGAGLRRIGAMSEEERREFLGARKEAVRAWSIFSPRMEMFTGRVGDLGEAQAATGTPLSAVNLAVQTAKENELLRSIFEARQERVGLQITEAGVFGPGRLQTQAARDRMARLGAGGRWDQRLGGRAGAYLAEYAGGDVEDVEQGYRSGKDLYLGLIQALTGSRQGVPTRTLKEAERREETDPLRKALEELRASIDRNTDTKHAPNPNGGDLD